MYIRVMEKAHRHPLKTADITKPNQTKSSESTNLISNTVHHQSPATAQRKPLQWRHDELDGVSNHQRLDCLLKRLFKRWLNKTSKPRLTGLCEGNSTVIGEFPAQRAGNAENVSIWWRHHDVGTDCRTHASKMTKHRQISQVIGHYK